MDHCGKIQLPDFQRGYKWEDERIRSLLVSILRCHPLGVVMLLATGGDLIRFKPRPVEGARVQAGTQPDLLLLDGQQRLTSLTQALTGSGVVGTKDSRGKLFDRRYYVRIETGLAGEERIDEAVISVRPMASSGQTSARTSTLTCRTRTRNATRATSRSGCSRSAERVNVAHETG